MLISNYAEDYKQSLSSAVKQHTSNSKGMRKPGYAQARSPYEKDFDPSMNENVQGVPSSTPGREKLFKLTQDTDMDKQYVNYNVQSHPQVSNLQAVPTPGQFKPDTHLSKNSMSTQTHVSRNKHLSKTPSNTYSIIEPPKNTGKPFK